MATNTPKVDEVLTPLLSLADFRDKIAARLLTPVPTVRTLRAWLTRGKVPLIKANPVARRGGGVVYVHRSTAEAYLRRRIGFAAR